MVVQDADLLRQQQDFNEMRKTDAQISHDKRMQILLESMFNPIASQLSILIQKGEMGKAKEVIEMFTKLSREQLSTP